MCDEENGHGDTTSDEEEGDLESLDVTGMPATSLHDAASPAIMYPAIMLGELCFGYLIAWRLYSLDKANMDVKILMLKEYGLGYLYLAVVIVTKIPYVMQTFVAVEGNAVNASNPDQYIYKTMLRSEPYVRLENRGRIGRFNRAQRAVDNMRETLPGILASLILGGFVFSAAALVTAMLLLAGRTLFIVGYIWRLRMPGVILSSLAGTIAGGFLLFSSVQALL
eukprot:gnl/TRDRNA2_/TRDRNA2_31966_c0_seq1.p1 gnl/TRDRNA2_/TRDRNA2_31966_c0~~gnl/TRDRNA2_/TRDRNA2_31966_c0_seq1.p1  ORF type:complete len:235 (+),score=29.03 gnl/TRDRNA2_/TRDRNA2_31966_c0_seq1:37-705(+)